MLTNHSNRGKGLMFYTFFECLERLRGKEAVDATRSLLTGEVAESLQNGGIVQNGWYPLSWYRQLHSAAQQATGDGANLAWEIGRLSAEIDLGSGVYRVLIRVLSPQFMISMASRLFNKYYEIGSMRVEQAEKHRAVAKYSGCEGFSRDIWYDTIGGAEGAMVVCGARDIAVRILSGGGDDEQCAVIEGRWA